jgi:hypothetical protein
MTTDLADLAALRPVLDAYRTCELLTVTRSGVPIAWPTIAEHRPDDGTFLITTSIALPQKALNVRRNPAVALLFSDPTGSGLTGPDQVLVQGTATCPERIVTSGAEHAGYWARLKARQPESRTFTATALGRRYFDFYYMRLIITVTPEAVRRRPALPPGAPLAAGPGPRRPVDAYDRAVRGLPGYTSGVLAAFDPDGRPTLLRVRPAARPGDRALVFDVPAGAALREGTASLLCHSHDELLWNQRSFGAAGTLTRDGDDRWRLTPDRYIPGVDNLGPIGMIRTIRQLRATAARYLDRRGLTRPAIPWQEYGV